MYKINHKNFPVVIYTFLWEIHKPKPRVYDPQAYV